MTGDDRSNDVSLEPVARCPRRNSWHDHPTTAMCVPAFGRVGHSVVPSRLTSPTLDRLALTGRRSVSGAANAGVGVFPWPDADDKVAPELVPCSVPGLQ